ncbi:hypothetical protein [Allosphingosinicella indica]|uniref:Secreted protein n=1 Tax=Allosphingosinicella indica TaxID=941907 RepID=A0A1X7FZS0_9SPHN|nr:hypothetical protein [Allosphingosinicella indica]SMF61620.1 hypothetical protein SAMN06295910_0612 [Allosphingosinicella indica]
MKRTILLAAALGVAGCATASTPANPQDAFFDRLSALCGKAFAGRIASPAVEADADFAGKALVMHVRECSDDVIRVPFHVGEDRSRTWVVTRTGAGLRLKHDHRHDDGSEDKLTQYGGDTAAPGTASRQEFPADQFSKDMFVAQGLPQSVPNVWAMEVEPGRLFAYELRRPSRFFRVDFDLTQPVVPPPPPWGS